MSFLEELNQNQKKENIHSWYLLIMSVLSLFFLLISSNFYLNGLLLGALFFYFFKNKLSAKIFFKIVLYSATFSFLFFLLNLLYSSGTNKEGALYRFSFLHFYFSLHQGAIDNAFTIFIRLFMLTLVSMSSTFAINYTRVVLYLIIHKGLKVFWGYPLLIALNSILLFKDEYDRIKISAKFRGLTWFERLFIFFPLLVFAIRHSQRGSLSLVTRGLSPHKSFYFNYAPSKTDGIILALFFGYYLCLMAIMFYFR